jgi:hypothetical protein
MESAKFPSKRDSLPIGGKPASNNFTTNEYTQNMLVQISNGTVGTSGGGNMSGAAGHRADESPRGYAGGPTAHPSPGNPRDPSRRVGGRRYNRCHNPSSNDEPETPEQRRRTNTSIRQGPERPKKNTRANMRIATLNVQGRGGNSLFDSRHKWHALNRMILTEKIGILCAQETHLTPEQTEEINKFHKNIHVFSMADPAHPNTRGVSIALNKKVTNTTQAKVTTLVQGRALLLELPWHANEIITVLAIYAPNDNANNKAFWDLLNQKWTDENQTLPYPDIMLGDFNMVEDSTDRCTGIVDSPKVTRSIANLKYTLSLIDG